MTRPSTHERVAYSARHLAWGPQAHLPGHARGGWSIGNKGQYRGVVIGFAPDWDQICFVRWDHRPEVAQAEHVDTLVREAEIGRDADRVAHAPSA